MFCSKDRIPSIFFMPDVLIKEKKKQSFINGLPKLAEDLRDKQDRGTSYEGIFVQVPSPHFKHPQGDLIDGHSHWV